MESFGAILRIVLQRSLANYRLLATVVVGIVLSSALMSSVIIYSDAIRDLGLKHTLAQKDPLSLDIKVVSSSQTAQQQPYPGLRDGVDAKLKAYAGGILGSIVNYGRSATFYLTAPGAPIPADANKPRSFFQFVDGLPEHVRVTDGVAPGAALAATADAPPRIEVWIGQKTADALVVRTGDEFDLHPFWRLDVKPIRVVVAGIIEPNDAAEEYWFGNDRFADTSSVWSTYPFFSDEATFVNVIAAYLPDIDGTFEFYGFVDPGKIDSKNARQVEVSVSALESDLRQSFVRTTMRSDLPSTIAAYREKLFFTRLPLFALMLQIVGIVLYYLVMVSGMVVERQAGEIALLKSRGASNAQIISIYGIEGSFLCAFAVVFGPILAGAAISALGPTPPFRDLSGGDPLEVHVTLTAVLMAGLGALLSFAAMLWPAYRATAYSVVHYKSHLARPPQQPAFLRYYLDLALIGVGAFAFYELRQRGSLVTDKLFGNLSADPLLLATPALFMLMIALVFLRLFPVILRVVSWAARGLPGATIPLGLWHLVRSPLQYTRLILLLLLVTAVGMFAAGFRATLERSYDDRSSYAAGADARIEGIREPARKANSALTEIVRLTTGAKEVTPVLRTAATYSPTFYTSEDVTMMGIDRASFKEVVYWRGDFAAGGLDSLLDKLDQPPGPGAEAAIVPPGVRFVGMWAKVALPQNAGFLGMRLEDGEGVFWTFFMGTEGARREDGWAFYVADLTRPFGVGVGGARPSSASPLQLDAVFVRLGGTPQNTERYTLAVDDLQYTKAEIIEPGWGQAGFTNGGVVIEPFEDLDRYELITGAIQRGDPGSLTRGEGAAMQGDFVGTLSFLRTRGGTPVVGMRRHEVQGALRVAVNSKFLSDHNAKIGDELRMYLNSSYVQVQIVASFDLFPSFDPAARGRFFVADLAALQAAGNRVPSITDNLFANEAWVKGFDGPALTQADLADKNLQANAVFDRSTIRAVQASDPLIAASWEGILFLAFAAVLVLTALGFVVSSYLAAQTRSLEFAILRTMGFTRRQIFALVTFEQFFVIIIGLVAGTLLGFPLVRLMIGYMGLTETGADVLPPLVSRVSWGAVAISYALLGIVFVATSMSLVVAYSRLAVHRALRMGEL